MLCVLPDSVDVVVADDVHDVVDVAVTEFDTVLLGVLVDDGVESLT